jgi:hypothetical protein
MRLRTTPLDTILGADVNLLPSKFQPQSASAREGIRFRNLAKTEDVAIKFARVIFTAWRNCDLDVMNF